MLEHLVASSILVYKVLGLLFNNFCLDNIQQFRLSFRLKVEVSSFLLLEYVLLGFSEVLRTVEAANPPDTLLRVFILASDQERLLELFLINNQVLVTLPNVIIILLDDICTDETHLNKGLYRVLQQIPVDILAIPVLSNLIQKSAP